MVLVNFTQRIKLRHNLHCLRESDPGSLISADGDMRIMLPPHNDEGDDDIRAAFVCSDEEIELDDAGSDLDG